MKRDVGYTTDDDWPRRKRRRFDEIDEKDYKINNGRKFTGPLMGPGGSDNDRDKPYVGPDVSNFKSIPQEFGKYIYIYRIR